MIKKQAEKILLRHRGYIYKLPIGENVIFTMTGGIDSSVGTELIIQKWHATVYPFYLKRGATAEEYELKSAEKVVSYLKEKYPSKIKNLMVTEAPVPPKNIKRNLSHGRIISRGHPLRNAIIQSYAIQYGVSLNDMGIVLDTIFVGSVASDYFAGSRDIDLIVNTLYTCVNLEEWKWQILSPFFQRGLLMGKDKIQKMDLIKWGDKNNFPFEITRTCTSGNETSCGECSECKERIKTFREAGLLDPIPYTYII